MKKSTANRRRIHFIGRVISLLAIIVYLSAGIMYLLCWGSAPGNFIFIGELPQPPLASPTKTADFFMIEAEILTNQNAQPEKAETSVMKKAETLYIGETKSKKTELPALRTQVQVIGHRGDSAFFPENTLLAFQSAATKKADWAELDVQQTSDGIIVVFHDNSLRRMTGKYQYIWECSLEELIKLDVGKRFDPVFTGTTIPTLDEVLTFTKGKIRLNIEIKENEYELSHPIAGEVVRMIEEHGMEEQIMITAYMHSTLKLVKDLNPRIKTALLCDKEERFTPNADEVDIFSVNADLITPDLVNRVHASGKKINAWVVDSLKRVETLAEYGVDSIISSNPAATIEYLYGKTGYFTRRAEQEEAAQKE